MRPLRIGMDGRTLVKPGRGVARATRGLLDALRRSHPEDEWRIHPAGRLARVALTGAAAAGRPRLDRMLGGGLDVVWLPEPVPVAVSPSVPFVLTLHDLSWETRPGDFTRYERAWLRLARSPRQAARAARVLAVSEATRAEALARWSLDPARVLVVRPGVQPPLGDTSESAVAAVRRRHGLSERYLLFVGALEPRKAPEVLAAAYRRARSGGLDADLAVAGEGREAAALREAGARLLGRVSDPELAALYAGALALVLPSRLEGFGFPPLEALAHGTAPVVSDLPALRENLGDGARYVPPGDPEALAGAMLEMSEDAGLRERIVAAGRPRLAGLTWERAAVQARLALAEAAQ